MIADGLQTISEQCDATIIIRGSKFIAHASSVAGKDIAEAYIAAISKRFHDATHNCFAYRVSIGDQTCFRFSDDGEPSGTAGRPILKVVESRELTNVAVVVTRYFGGTKLGTGGLMRAYREATSAVLNKAQMVRFFPQSRIRLRFPYQHSNTVYWLIGKFHGEILQKSSGQKQIYKIRLKSADVKNFCRDIQNQLKGNADIDVMDLNADNRNI